MGKPLAPGLKAPEFTLPLLGGASTSLHDLLADGPVVLAFYKISCPVCQLTLPYLERLKDNGRFRVIGISQDSADHTRHFERSFKVTLPSLLDDGSRDYPATRAYGVTSVPTLFSVEPDGTISSISAGFSKRDLTALGERAGRAMFTDADRVPEFRPG